MNDLKNLSEIRNLLAAHPFFTYDYADGLCINKDSKHIWVYSINSRTSGLHNYWTQKTSPGIHPGRGTR